MKKIFTTIILICLCSATSAQGEGKDQDYQQYLAFFEEVYKTMETNYYLPVRREAFERFIRNFDGKIYKSLRRIGKPDKYIKWRSAAYLIDYLKSPEDSFSAFYPPKPAKEYEQTALGKRVDLGIEGKLEADGYHVTQVEPRADSYLKGLRINDILRKIDQKDVLKLTEKEIRERLNPLEGTQVNLVFLAVAENIEKSIQVTTVEYFKQTVFMVPIPVPGVYCLQIQRFNQKTSEDMLLFIRLILKYGPEASLILDLRGNPGGPPLAAREISSFFLPPKQEFAYFQKRNQPKAILDIPAIPAKYHFDGPMVILVDHDSGSASELFSGVMQRRGRAVIMGTNTAGKVFLKSMFHFDDESMVLLVTGRGYHPDGSVFSFDGVVPNHRVESPSGDDLVILATQYLVALRQIP